MEGELCRTANESGWNWGRSCPLNKSIKQSNLRYRTIEVRMVQAHSANRSGTRSDTHKDGTS